MVESELWVCHMFEQWHGHVCVDVASVLVSTVHLVSCGGAGFVQTLSSLDVKDDGDKPCGCTLHTDTPLLQQDPTHHCHISVFH